MKKIALCLSLLLTSATGTLAACPIAAQTVDKTAPVLGINQPVSGEGTCWYQFTLPEAGFVTLNIHAEPGDYYTNLYNSASSNIWHEDQVWESDTGYNDDTYQFSLEKGVYYLKFTADRFTLELGYEPINSTEAEPNNPAEKAQPLELNQEMRGQISQDESYDFYSFSLDKKEIVRFDIKAVRSFLLLYIYNEAGKKVWEDTANVNNALGFGTATFEIELNPGKYILEMEGGTYAKRIGNYTFSLNTTSSTPPAAGFKDVFPSDYYYDAVNWAVENGITTGKSADIFDPQSGCTRADIVTFLYRAMGSPEVGEVINPFRDVRTGDYFYKPVMWAVKEGITTGKTYNTFKPNDTCTRAEAMTFLYRCAGSPNYSANSSFNDVKEGDYYAAPCAWAADAGITTGTKPGEFSPLKNCIRADIVTMIKRWKA